MKARQAALLFTWGLISGILLGVRSGFVLTLPWVFVILIASSPLWVFLALFLLIKWLFTNHND